jgi:GNAT superfamily N-acetyltransferase
MHTSTIAAYLRAAGSIGRTTAQIGPFFATVSESVANPYLSYGIPDDGADPTPADVAGFVAFYRDRGRTPRLEYIAELAPSVEPALMAAGFVIEGRLPLMATAPGAVSRSIPVGVDIEAPVGEDDVRGLVTVLAEAYGDPAPTDDDVRRRSEALARGGIALVARHRESGLVVGGGSCSRLIDGITEVAGIGVAAAQRRHGIGQALGERLAETAMERGATSPFLMAAHESEARMYARAGFTPVGEMLHMSWPA